MRRVPTQSAAWLIVLALLVPASSAVFAARGDDVADPLARARTLYAAKDWKGTVALLKERLQRDAGDAPTLEMYGGSLLQLGRNDEAAHYLELAARRYATDGKEDKGRWALSQLRVADPLALRRDAFFKKVVDTLYASADELNDEGHAERALAILERLPAAVAPGKDGLRVQALLDKVRATFETVSLDDSASKQRASGELALQQRESEHYKFACHLEPDVVNRLGGVMDDIHAFYVQVYFDGDAKKARGDKPTIRVHATKKQMLEGWGGASAPEGWWSPGSNEVITFDTRSRAADGTGSLDDMLVTLFHEASHQFMTLLARGGFTPAWLNEGTATFFEGATAMADGRVLWPGPALGRLHNLASDLRGKDPLGADKCVSFSGGGSYGPEYYAWGWGLVYFLLEYEDPATLEYAYRPLYSAYRSKVIQQGGEPMKAFEEVFLGKHTPLKHATFAQFEADWRKWILTEVAPLYAGTRQSRELHLTKVAEYLTAAERVKAAGKPRKDGVDEAELLRRALGHIEYVRTKLDTDVNPDGELIVRQAEVLERLKRPAGAAPLFEKALDLADQARFVIDEKRYADLEKRLQRIDRKNAALRASRSRAQLLARAAAVILADYKNAKEHLLLRGYSFAAVAGAVLQDDKVLLPAADALRKEARDKGLLLGQVRSLDTPKDGWKTSIQSPPRRFEVGRDQIALDCVRYAGFVDQGVTVMGEYELRVRVAREHGVDPGSALGVVVAARADSDWIMIGVDERGAIGIWRLEITGKGSSSLARAGTLFPQPLLDTEKPIDLVVHVGRDQKVLVTAGGGTPLEWRLPIDPGIVRGVGVFAKNTQALFTNALVEIYP